MPQQYFCRLSVHPDAIAEGEFPPQSTKLYYASTDYIKAERAGSQKVQGAAGKTIEDLSCVYFLDRDTLLRLMRHDAELWGDTMGKQKQGQAYAAKLYQAYISILDNQGEISFAKAAAGIRI